LARKKLAWNKPENATVFVEINPPCAGSMLFVVIRYENIYKILK